MNPDLLAELEEERRFHLASIRDIEREYAAGDIDDDDYRTLRDGHVARAAAVMREIEAGRRALAPKPPRSLWRRVAIIGSTLAVAIALGVFVAQSAGQRLPGQTLTGGAPMDEVAVKLAEARQALGVDSAVAIAAYQEVLAIEPQNAEALTYTAWLIVQNGSQTGNQGQVRDGLELLRIAATVDPTYADPHCFIAITSANIIEPPDPATVVAEGQECLDRNPPAALGPAIQNMMATAEAEVAPPTT